MDSPSLSVLEVLILIKVKAAWISSIVKSVLAWVLVKDRAAVRSSWLRDSMALVVIAVSGIAIIRLPFLKVGLFILRVRWSGSNRGKRRGFI